jgi:hypothetical protein
MRRRNKLMVKGLRVGLVLSSAILASAQQASAINPVTASPDDSDSSARLALSSEQSSHSATTYSAGIGELIQLLDAKMDEQVVVNYIQNSPLPYNPSARDLVALKEHGASSEVLIAVLQRGNEVRLQLAQAQRAANSQRATTGAAYSQEGAYAAYPTYPYDNSDYSYSGYPSTYYSYNYGLPLVYGPRFPINLHRPLLNPHGRFSAQRGGGPLLGGHRAGPMAGAAAAVHGPRMAAGQMGGHPGFSAQRSGGFRGGGSARPAGRVGGRGR